MNKFQIGEKNKKFLSKVWKVKSCDGKFPKRLGSKHSLSIWNRIDQKSQSMNYRNWLMKDRIFKTPSRMVGPLRVVVSYNPLLIPSVCLIFMDSAHILYPSWLGQIETTSKLFQLTRWLHRGCIGIIGEMKRTRKRQPAWGQFINKIMFIKIDKNLSLK